MENLTFACCIMSNNKGCVVMTILSPFLYKVDSFVWKKCVFFEF